MHTYMPFRFGDFVSHGFTEHGLLGGPHQGIEKKMTELLDVIRELYLTPSLEPLVPGLLREVIELQRELDRTSLFNHQLIMIIGKIDELLDSIKLLLEKNTIPPSTPQSLTPIDPVEAFPIHEEAYVVIEETPQTVEDERYDEKNTVAEEILHITSSVEVEIQDTLEVDLMLPTLSPSVVIQSQLFEWIPIRSVFSMGPHEQAILETDDQLQAICGIDEEEIIKISWAQK